MHLFAFALIALQVFFAIHAIRNGKDTLWLWLIILAPGIGCAIYFFTQFLPHAAGSQTARRVKRGLIKAVDPQREYKRRRQELERADTVANRLRLADECIEAGLHEEAITLLQPSLRGLHGDDPHLLLTLAGAQFGNRDPAAAIATLDDLIKRNPDFRSVEGHLLYARSLEANGQRERACAEYEVLRESYPGEEARVRYGQLLMQLGKRDDARAVFSESIKRAALAPKSYRRREREWLQIAERESAA